MTRSLVLWGPIVGLPVLGFTLLGCAKPARREPPPAVLELLAEPVVDRRLSIGRASIGRRAAEIRARDIVRRPGNPFLRYVGGAALQATDEPSIPPTAAQEKLPL